MHFLSVCFFSPGLRVGVGSLLVERLCSCDRSSGSLSQDGLAVLCGSDVDAADRASGLQPRLLTQGRGGHVPTDSRCLARVVPASLWLPLVEDPVPAPARPVAPGIHRLCVPSAASGLCRCRTGSPWVPRHTRRSPSWPLPPFPFMLL